MIGEGTHSTNQCRHTFVRDNVEVGFFTDPNCVHRLQGLRSRKNFRSGPRIGFCLAEVTHTSSLSRLTSISELQNHALDMRVNVEGRWSQKTDERLVVFARELDRKT
jgi:hypothetical protein